MFNKPINPWWTVAAGALGAGLGVGIFVVYVLSVLIKPIVADLGFDRSVLSFSLTCFLIANGFGSISLGILINRWGVRRPAILYVIVCVACVALLPLIPGQPWCFYLLFAVLGVGGAAATAFPYSVAITSLFDRRRGLALGLAVAGGGVGSTFGPQLANSLLGAVGWRETIWIIAVIMAIPALAMLLLVRSLPADVAAASRPKQSQSHWSLYLGKRQFWLIGAAIVGVSVGTFGVLAILVPLLTDRGIAASRAAAILSVAGFSSWGGRIVIGWLLDRVWAPAVTSLVCFGAFAGVVLLAFGGAADPLMFAGAGLMGLALGAEADVLIYLCSRYFGREAFSRVVGSMWVMWAWGGGLGTAAAGLAYRLTGAYDTAILFFAGPLFLGTATVLLLGPYVFPPAESKRPPAKAKIAGDLPEDLPLEARNAPTT